MLDLIIHGGMVVDGTGAPARMADIGIREGRVEVIQPMLEVSPSVPRLAADGLTVTPGFVDIHSHSDFTLLLDPRAHSAIAQGVTTEVVGNCGHGCAPIDRRATQRFAANIYGYGPDIDIDWSSMDEYLSRLADRKPALNVASLVPNGNLRLAVLDQTHRPASAVEVRQMQRLLEQALDEGAFGFSTGLEYAAERACSEDEVAALCAVAARYDGLYATHTRNKEALAVEAVEEGIRAASASATRLQVSHIIPRRGGPPDALDRCLVAVERARDAGVDAAFDIHTRLFGLTNLSAVLPPSALDEGIERLRTWLSDRDTRAEMKTHRTLISSFLLGGAERIYLLDTPHCPQVSGHSLAELTPRHGDVYDVMFDVLLAEIEQLHRPQVICWSYDEAQLAYAASQPWCMIGSDATTMAPDGPLARTTFHGAYTWAAWFFRRCVRERGEVTLEEAVRKLTSLPAAHAGLVDRGVLRPGGWADLAIFDPQQFGERGTVEHPNQLAEGMVHVIVNGRIARRDGQFTAERAGRVLRRGTGQ